MRTPAASKGFLRLLTVAIPAALLLSCSGGRISPAGSGDTPLLQPLGGARLAEREIDPVVGNGAVLLPSGDLVVCTGASPEELGVERLNSRLETVWRRSIPLPPSGRTMSSYSGAIALPADEPVHVARAGAAIAILSVRRSGADSVALTARLFDTATGRMLRDTVTMRRAFDGSIPEIARVPTVAVSPGRARVAVAVRTRAYGVEMTDLAIQIFDPYLNPLETRRIRLPVVEEEGRTDLHVTDDGTILLLSRNRGDSAEILRITPGTSAPARRSAIFTGGGDSLHLRSYVTALGRDGLLRIAAEVYRGDDLAGIATGLLDFAIQDRVLLRFAPFGSGALGRRPAYAAIHSLHATPEGSIVVMAARTAHDRPTADGSDVVIAALARDGRPIWSRSVERIGTATRYGRAAASVDAQVDESGPFRLTYVRDSLLELRLYATRDGAALLPGEARRLMAIGTSDWAMDGASIAWLDDRRAIGLLQRYDDLRRIARLWKLDLP